MSKVSHEVFIIDDDHSIRKSLERLIKTSGYNVKTFTIAEEFLQAIPSFENPSCLILDIRMPGISGIDLQKELINKDISLPIIFITGHGDIPTSVKAMKNGAIDFLPKPFEDKELLSAIETAINKDIFERKKYSEITEIQKRIDKLTSREYDVLRWVITGMLNKQIAYELGVTEKTIKVHRGRVMQKMQVLSVAELVRMTDKCGITPAQ